MRVPFLLSGVLLSSAFLCTTVEDPSEFGAIKGQIEWPDTNGTNSTVIEVEGTNLAASVDSQGHFTIYVVPAGTYDLSVRSRWQPSQNAGTGFSELSDPNYLGEIDTVIAVAVSPGDTFMVPVLHFAVEDTTPQAQEYGYRDLMAYTRDDSVYILEVVPMAGDTVVSGGNLWKRRSLAVDTSGTEQPFALVCITRLDTLGLRFTVTTEGTGATFFVNGGVMRLTGIPVEIPVTVTANRDTVYSGTPVKGIVKTRMFCRAGEDTVRFYFADQRPTTIVFLDSVRSKTATKSFLSLTTGQPTLRKYRSPSLVGNGWAALCGKDTVVVLPTTAEAINWDLMLVRDSTHDTCYWREPAQQWSSRSVQCIDGVPTTSAGCPKGQYCWNHRYEPDRIASEDLPAGNYSVLVKYFDGPADSATATPTVTMLVGRDAQTSIVQKLYVLRSPTPLKKEDVWVAGTLTFPSGEFSDAGQKVVSHE